MFHYVRLIKNEQIPLAKYIHSLIMIGILLTIILNIYIFYVY